MHTFSIHFGKSIPSVPLNYPGFLYRPIRPVTFLPYGSVKTLRIVLFPASGSNSDRAAAPTVLFGPALTRFLTRPFLFQKCEFSNY